jgi:hypothetical protein
MTDNLADDRKARINRGGLLAPITADAKTPKMVPVQMHNGKTVQLHAMKVHGQMMILVPMEWPAKCLASPSIFAEFAT